MSQSYSDSNIADFNNLLNKSSVVITLFAKKGCGACILATPIFNYIASKSPKDKALFATIYSHTGGDLFNKYNIKMVPTFIIFVNGEPLARMEGLNLNNLEDIADKIGITIPDSILKPIKSMSL